MNKSSKHIYTLLSCLLIVQHFLSLPCSLAIVKPVKHFLEHDLEQVKITQKTYHKAHSEAMHLTDKMCQVSTPPSKL